MRPRGAAAVASLAAVPLVVGALGLALGACLDLFHSTGDVLTACQLDPSRAGCTPEAGGPQALDSVAVCAATSLEARQQADRACAWLGACEAPMGRNAFGPCTLQARMAYDCASNPNHRVAGGALTFWRCMLAALTCTDVAHCVFPAGPEMCPGSGAVLGCGTGGNGDVVVACDGGSARGENCAMAGQTCALGGNGGVGCTGAAGFACDASECSGKLLHWCPGASPVSVDVGIDCADNGAQECSVFPSPTRPWAACVAGPADASASCAPSATAGCSGGVAAMCTSGVAESLDCATLLGTANACVPGPLSPPFDWTAPCALSPPACTADACDDAGTTLLGCTRGAVVAVSCAEAGLGPCEGVSVPGDADAGGALPACTPP